MINTKRLPLLAFAIATIIAPTDASARLRGGLAIPANAPVLTSSTVNFGTLTLTAKGAVRLSSMDKTTAAVKPFTFSGLGVETPGVLCTNWTLAFVSNTSGRPSTDFTLPAAGVAEGSAAITPVPSSTGVNHLVGDYVWNVSCTAGAASSNTAQLTYHSIANAINLGTTDGFPYYPSGFGNVAGAKILWSTGVDRSGGRLTFKPAAVTFANQVVMQDADSARPGAFTNLEINSTSNMKVSGLTMSGDQTIAQAGGAGCTICGKNPLGDSYTGLIFENIHGYFSEATMAGNSSWSTEAFNGCASGCQSNHNGYEYVATGWTMGTGTAATVNGTYLRYMYRNSIFAGNGQWTFNDVMLISPQTFSSDHTDFAQICDGCTPESLTINRMLTAQADGDDQAQGVVFGGTALNAAGYVANGALTLTSGVLLSGSNGSHIYSTAGSPMAISDNIKIASGCSPSSCNGSTVATLNSPINIGSAGSPVPIFTVNENNMQINGYSASLSTFHGMNTPGEQGTSFFKNVTSVQQNANPFYQTSFTGTIVGNVLTVAGPITNNIPGVVVPFIGSGQRLSYTGCNYLSSCAIDIQLTGPGSGAGTYRLLSSPGNIGPVPMSSSGSYPITGAGFYAQLNCGTAGLHGGTFTVASAYIQGGDTGGGSCPAANTTKTNFFGNTLTGADFLSGVLPQTTLQAISASTWKAMSAAQALAADCNAKLPATSGALDAGGGLWYGAYTQTGEWNDGSGTPVIGCGIH